jgi:hypothetical protein
MVFVIVKKESSPIGISKGKASVESHRSVYEKKPWKNLPGLSGVVETQFVRPLYSGDGLYPFKTGKPKLALIPCSKASLLSQESIDLHPGLQSWCNAQHTFGRKTDQVNDFRSWSSLIFNRSSQSNCP